MCLTLQQTTQDLCSPITCITTQRCIINREYQALLEQHQLGSFEALFRFQGGEAAKTIRERSVTRFEVEAGGAKTTFYLKRHKLSFVGIKRLLALFFPNTLVSEGIKEFKSICDFRASKLATVVPVAAGEKFVNFFWVESFLLTEDFSPFIQLEDLVTAQPAFFKGREGRSVRQRLLKEIAVFAQRMHARGFNHRDFNTTHILVKYNAADHRPELAVFDLQRVDKARLFRFRWMIKSLARVNYSLPDHLFTAKDIIYLFMSYKGKNAMNFMDRCQWFWIRRKTGKIRKHTEKIMRAAIKQSEP
ncbi:MAG TPA: hypothetical protein DD405_02070 [Desulfobacteraceae bacterium]|nr:hypothetical protein [Desulfobacteraceae bacterium]